MDDKATTRVTLVPATNTRKKRSSQFLCSAITYVALAIIILLAIPMCLLIGAIGCVWSVTDKIVRTIED